MKTKKLLASAAVAVTATGMTLVSTLPVSAQSYEDRSQIINRTSDILGIPSQELVDAFKQAQIEQLEEKIQNGEIDAEEGVALIQKIDESDGLHFASRRTQRPLVQEHKQDVMEFLGVSEDEFRSYMQDGQSLLDIADDKNISEDSLREYIADIHRKSIEENNNLTAEQKEQRLERVYEMVDRIIRFTSVHHQMGINFGS